MGDPADIQDRRPPVIGLLGAPGSGKSAIARRFAALGSAVVDADQLAREAMRDPAIIARVRAVWGDAVVDVEGRIDRSRLGGVVFNDPAQRRRLEGIIHPYVNRRRSALHREVLSRGGDRRALAIVEDCPLLLEAGLAGGCDALVFVDCPLAERQRRVLASRGWSPEELVARESAQLPLDTKRAAADYTIDNAGEDSTIQRRVADVLHDIQKAFARR